MTLELRPISHLSVSQLERWLFCPRFWALDRLDGELEREETPNMTRGKRVHVICEHLLKDAPVPAKEFELDLAQKLVTEVKHNTKPPYQTEHAFTIPAGMLGQYPVQGVIDVVTHDTIIDYKVGKGSYKPENSVQLYTYAIAQPTKYVAYCTINPSLKTPKAKWKCAKINDNFLDDVFALWWGASAKMQEHSQLQPQHVPGRMSAGQSCVYYGKPCIFTKSCRKITPLYIKVPA